jgi:hypothetical protein
MEDGYITPGIYDKNGDLISCGGAPCAIIEPQLDKLMRIKNKNNDK